MRGLCLVICLLFPVMGLAADDWRTFTDVDGRQMVAKILRVEATFVVVEIKANGHQVPIDFEKLSVADVAYLKDHKEAAKTAKTDPTPDGTTPDDATPDGTMPDGDAKRLYPRTRQEIQDGIREIGKRTKPKDLSREVHEATTRLNIYRFLCGVPAEVEGDAEFSKNAREAALACKANGGLSHSLGHFTNKCNISSMGDVVASVAQYIEDGGDNNRDARGHRAWCLNPPMGKVGFGSAGGSFSAMWCMDGSGKAADGIWAYPGRGLFPLDYLHGNAWSLYGAGQAGAADKLKVEMYRHKKRPEQAFADTGEIPGREIKVNHVSRGMNHAINFEPAEPAKRGIYWVRVNGGSVHAGYLVELY
jgi:hypothetical protein